MIISRIIGGLGNQLFQYAAGRSLAVQHQTELALDVSAFDENKLRHFDLAAFHTNIRFAQPREIAAFTNRGFVEKLRDNIFPMTYRKVYKPKHFHFNKKFFNASSGIYLHGYWQSEKFFSPVTDLIRKEFTIREEYIRGVIGMATEMRERPSVSIHIRRGDYHHVPMHADMHGTLGRNYYSEAIGNINKMVPGAVFYFFSDDINWVKENLPVEQAVYISGIHTQTHFEDFYLMSQCRHNIIANSSFSWWAAWLNPHPGKIVIAPKNWFAVKRINTSDLIPANWIRI